MLQNNGAFRGLGSALNKYCKATVHVGASKAATCVVVPFQNGSVFDAGNVALILEAVLIDGKNNMKPHMR